MEEGFEMSAGKVEFPSKGCFPFAVARGWKDRNSRDRPGNSMATKRFLKGIQISAS